MTEQSILSALEVRGAFARWALKSRNDFQTLATTGWTESLTVGHQHT